MNVSVGAEIGGEADSITSCYRISDLGGHGGMHGGGGPQFKRDIKCGRRRQMGE